jgi:DNA repair protein RadC
MAHEVFAVLFLDSQNRFIALEEMFRGTLSQTSVYRREVVKSALRHGAASDPCAQPPTRYVRAITSR